jgi:hypothetical protein
VCSLPPPQPVPETPADLLPTSPLRCRGAPTLRLSLVAWVHLHCPPPPSRPWIKQFKTLFQTPVIWICFEELLLKWLLGRLLELIIKQSLGAKRRRGGIRKLQGGGGTMKRKTKRKEIEGDTNNKQKQKTLLSFFAAAATSTSPKRRRVSDNDGSTGENREEMVVAEEETKAAAAATTTTTGSLPSLSRGPHRRAAAKALAGDSSAFLSPGSHDQPLPTFTARPSGRHGASRTVGGGTSMASALHRRGHNRGAGSGPRSLHSTGASSIMPRCAPPLPRARACATARTRTHAPN